MYGLGMGLNVLNYKILSVTEPQPGKRVTNACKHHSVIRVVQMSWESQRNNPHARRGTLYER